MLAQFLYVFVLKKILRLSMDDFLSTADNIMASFPYAARARSTLFTVSCGLVVSENSWTNNPPSYASMYVNKMPSKAPR
jgi:hypothetical protein